jgi:cytochrome P450
VTNPYYTSEAGGSAPAGYPEHVDAVRLYGTRFQNDPGALYRRIRRDYGPVAPVLLEGDVPAWLVVGYREVHHVLTNTQMFGKDSRRWNSWDKVPDNWPLLPFVGYQPSVLFAEGEEHQRRAGVISDSLAALDQFELRTLAERTADQLIDRFAGRGEADLVSEYADQIPLLVVLKLFGLPDAEMSAMVRDVAASMEAGPDANEAHQRIMTRMREIVRERRANPRADLPSHMVSHDIQLAEDELVVDLFMVMAAAVGPTGCWIGTTLRLMLTDDRFAVNLAGGRSSVGQALNEVLWEDTPTQNVIGRWATLDTQLGGKRVRKGDLMVLCLAAANGDPQVRPDSYDGSGGNQAYMSFCHGEHRCPFPAPEMAEIMAEAAIEVLLDRLPDVALQVEPEALVWRPSAFIRGLVSLPVEFTPGFVAGGPAPINA